MAVKIKLKRNPTPITVRATFNNTEAVATLKREIGASNYDRLDHLKDVVEGMMPEDGSTLVYDQQTDKYEVKKISIENIDGDLDGGNF